MQATVTALAEEFAFSRLIGVFAAFADKDVEGVLELLEPVLDEIVITRNSSPRSLRPGRAGQVAVECSARTGCMSVAELPDAIEEAVALAESDQDRALSGVGIIVTGSVVTVADARKLLKR